MKKEKTSKTDTKHCIRSLFGAGPDGGHAWIVALAACGANFIVAGMGRMSAILYVAFIEMYQVDRRSASMPFSVRSSVRNLLGPVAGILGQKYGVRPVATVGGILASLSTICCFFLHDILSITILWGLLNGLGASLLLTLPQIVIGQHFKKYTTTASGIAYSGGCVAAFILPSLLDVLLREYGIPGTFLIVGALMMHTIPAAMLLRKPLWLKQKKACTAAEVTHESSKPLVPNSIDNHSDHPNVQYLINHRAIVLEVLAIETSADQNFTFPFEINQNQHISSMHLRINDMLNDLYRKCLALDDHVPNLLMNGSACTNAVDKKNNFNHMDNFKSHSFQSNLNSIFDSSVMTKTNSAPDMSSITKDIMNNYLMQKLKQIHEVEPEVPNAFSDEEASTASRVIKELQKLYFVVSMSEEKQSRLKKSQLFDDIIITPIINSNTNSNSVWHHLKTAVNLHKSPMFLLISLSRSINFMTFVPIFTIVVDFMKDKGLTEAEGRYAVSVISLGDLIGRLCLGWITDRKCITLPRYVMIVTFTQGVVTLLTPFMDTKATIFVVLSFFGMLQGSLFVHHNVAVTKYTKSDQQFIAMGSINFSSGLLGFAFPAYIGYFRDVLKTYDYIFYINGALNVFLAFLWAFEKYFVRISQKTTSTPV